MRVFVFAFAWLLVAVSSPFANAAGAVPNSEYAGSTLVIYNKAVPESRELAAYYAKQRKIDLDLIIGLDCPTLLGNFRKKSL